MEDHLVLLPEDALVLLLAADLLVVVQLLRHLLRHRGLPLHCDLLDDVLTCIIESARHQTCMVCNTGKTSAELTLSTLTTIQFEPSRE